MTVALSSAWVPTPANRRLQGAVAELDRTVQSFIASGRSRQHPGDDLLSRLLVAQHEDGTRMSDLQLRDEAMTLYLAGHETTALTLAWSWYLLSQNPNVENKLVSEWQHILAGATPTADHLHHLPYTGAVIAESMRLFPPVYGIGREATDDLELGRYRVKRGYTVLMSQWVNHRDPKYFPESEEFRPERWENGLAKRIPKFAYYPFGGGQRICPGEHLCLDGSGNHSRRCWAAVSIHPRPRCGNRHQAADYPCCRPTASPPPLSVADARKPDTGHFG